MSQCALQKQTRRRKKGLSVQLLNRSWCKYSRNKWRGLVDPLICEIFCCCCVFDLVLAVQTMKDIDADENVVPVLNIRRMCFLVSCWQGRCIHLYFRHQKLTSLSKKHEQKNLKLENRFFCTLGENLSLNLSSKFQNVHFYELFVLHVFFNTCCIPMLITSILHHYLLFQGSKGCVDVRRKGWVTSIWHHIWGCSTQLNTHGPSWTAEGRVPQVSYQSERGRPTCSIRIPQVTHTLQHDVQNSSILQKQ